MRRIGLALCIMTLIGAGAAGASYIAHRNRVRIGTAKGIDEADYLRIGGIDQWVQIRGDDRENPVLLWLNGGPGFSTRPGTFAFRDWEKRFTVVMWDQRDEGKTFALSGTSVEGTMTIAQMTNDGIEVANWVRTRLGKDKIVLLGHSWGSMLGVHMVDARPDLFSVYVGTGQVVNLEKDAEAACPLLLERARALHNAAAEGQLVGVGPPPLSRGRLRQVCLGELGALDPPIKGLSSFAFVWPAMANIVTGRSGFGPDAQFSGESLWGEMLGDDFSSLGLRFDLPSCSSMGLRIGSRSLPSPGTTSKASKRLRRSSSCSTARGTTRSSATGMHF